MGLRADFFIDSRFSDAALVGIAVKKICQFHFRLGDVDAYRLEVSLIEATNNAIQHAYEAASGHEVNVRLELSEESVVLEVRDQGKPIPRQVFERRPSLDFSLDDLEGVPEGGMGRFIMQEFMDGVRYRSGAAGNVLRLEKRYAAGKRTSKASGESDH